jgi:hypothetical protein
MDATTVISVGLPLQGAVRVANVHMTEATHSGETASGALFDTGATMPDRTSLGEWLIETDMTETERAAGEFLVSDASADTSERRRYPPITD